MIGPTDLYVLAGVVSSEEETFTLRGLAATLHVDHTLVHRALRRAENAGLYRESSRQVHLANFEELAIHAARFIAPARLGELTRGLPAAWAASRSHSSSAKHRVSRRPSGPALADRSAGRRLRRCTRRRSRQPRTHRLPGCWRSLTRCELAMSACAR